MPKLLTWRDEWSLHIEALDKDHRALIERLADICLRFCPEASAGRAGDAMAMLSALAELGEQVRAHFRREETFMQALGYEGLAEHRREHAMLMAEFTAMMREWRADSLHVFDAMMQGVIRDWLLAHILGADRDFAEAYFRLCGQDPFPEHRRAMAQLQSSYRATLGSAPSK